MMRKIQWTCRHIHGSSIHQRNVKYLSPPCRPASHQHQRTGIVTDIVENGKRLAKAIALPNGIILTSGPTGSGKSTTLYSCLAKLNKPDVNIMTLEDPVENTIDGVSQSQVFPDIGYTFGRGLRTALRQDPDIIMVWEIRDKETINIAIEASLTGHLVLSTIHTNSAAETWTRILNMGIPAYLLPAAINAIIAQRLIRRLCNHCKKPVKPEELRPELQASVKKAISRTSRQELQDRVGMEKLQAPVFYEPVGCEKCGQTGYSGLLVFMKLWR